MHGGRGCDNLPHWPLGRHGLTWRRLQSLGVKMRRPNHGGTPILVATMAISGTAGAGESLEAIEVEGEAVTETELRLLPRRDGREADTAEAVKEAAGGSTADNGPLSSQVQYRGLFGPRMNVTIDGASVTPGGPNWMDPPLHYLPQGQLESIELERGIAPVSAGSGGLGGRVRATSHGSEFTDHQAVRFGGFLDGSLRSVNDSSSANGFVESANNRHRFHAGVATDRGNDARFGDGTIEPTSFERDQGRIGYGTRGHWGELGLSFQRTETGDSGNPTLPLDIKLFDTNRVQMTFERSLGEGRLNVQLVTQSVDHEMTNFRLRNAPDFNPMSPGPDRRRVIADSTTHDLNIGWQTPLAGGTFAVGSDLHKSSHDMVIRDPDRPNFSVTQFNDAETERVSGFAEWRGDLTKATSGELGLRVSHNETDAGRVDGSPAQVLPPPQRLRDTFNSRDRDRKETNVDAAAELDYRVSEAVSLQLGAARKTRSPSYIERYLWLPLEVSAGRGDGNNYVGNPDLDPEAAHKVDLGVDWTTGSGYFRPRVFFSHIEDFIAGKAAQDSDAITVSTLNGDATPLRFSNVDARLYGMDLEWGANLSPAWRLDGTVSVVRGERENGDPLFRLPADRAISRLTYRRGDWSATLESELAAPKTRISEAIVENEQGTTNDDVAGYGLVHLGAAWRPSPELRLSAGIDNLFDKAYRSATRGFNRVSDSDVPLGGRLFGNGRNFHLNVKYTF